MSRRSNEPFLWALFSAGGVVAALLLPVHAFLFGVAIPLGWVAAPSWEHLATLARLPLARLYLFVFCSLTLFHWAHRFRYTLYDGLQVKHLNEVINVFSYGAAVVGMLTAAYLIWNM